MKKVINVLGSEIYNHIAAGEVVERPASVIKELVENSIDAESTQIDIEIQGGGISLMKVSDNGIGIDKEFVKTAFLPHATSKLNAVSDLDSISTLGFRGEALSSIAAVAKVTMTSKTSESEVATSVSFEGGKFLKEFETGRQTGTTTIVTDLFFNVPARKKFLKKESSEQQEITALISRFILAHPEISFTYKADNKLIFSSTGSSLSDAIFAVYGKDAVTETLEVNLKKGNYGLKGYIGRPSFSKPNRTYQTLVINGRYVINNTVSAAITNAYGEMLMKRKYPFYVLHLSIPYDSVDVNVHPNKLDVRFENTSLIYSLFFEGVSRALSNMDYVSLADDKSIEKEIDKLQTSNILTSLKEIDVSGDIAVRKEFNLPLADEDDKISDVNVNTATGVNYNPFSKDMSSLSQDEQSTYKNNVLKTVNEATNDAMKDGFGLGSKLLERLANAKNQEEKDKWYVSENYKINEITSQQVMNLSPKVKIVGKIFNTYLIVELEDNVYFIDQHAAHEKLLYEQFKAEYDTKSIAIQPLLFPYVLTVNPLEANIIDENLDTMRELGFEIDEFGANTFKLNGVPVIISDMNFDKFFSEFLQDNKNVSRKSSDLIKDYLMQHSCKSAIKGGNDLSELEVCSLLEKMGDQKISLFCPHGRPIVIRVSKSEIEKWFKRIV